MLARWTAILSLICALAPVWGAPAMPRVAFQRAGLRDAPSNIVVMDLDGGRPADLADDPRAPLPRVTPALSPDGRTLLFAAKVDDAFKLFLWTLDDDHVAQGAPRRLTPDRESSERLPAWSPDGKRVAYLGTDKAGATWLRTINTDGRNPKVLCRVGYEAPPAWDPAGQYLLFVDTEGGAPVLKEMPADGEVRAALPVRRELRIVSAAYAPDGRRIAALAQGADDLLDLWVLAPAGPGGARVLTGIVGAKNILWPDDDRLVLSAARVGERADGAVWRLAPDGSGLAAAPGYASPKLITYVAMRQAPTATPVAVAPPVWDPIYTGAGALTPMAYAMPMPPRPLRPRLQPGPPLFPLLPPLPGSPALLAVEPLLLGLPPVDGPPTRIALVAQPANFAGGGDVRPPVGPIDPPRTGPTVIRRPVQDGDVRGVTAVDVAVAPEVASVVVRMGGQFVGVLPTGGMPIVTIAWDTQELAQVDPARGVPTTYSAFRRFPDGPCAIIVQGLDAQGRPVGRDTITVVVRNDVGAPPADLLRYIPTDESPTPLNYMVHGEGRVVGTATAGLAGLTATLDATLVRAMVDERTARYSLKGGTGLLTVGTARVALPEGDVSSLYAEPESGAITLARTSYAQWLLPLAHLRGPLAPAGGDATTWQAPTGVVVDILGRDLTWLAGTHTVDGVEWLGDRRAVRVRTVLQANDPIALAPTAVRMPPGMRPTQPPAGLTVRATRGLRLTWIDEDRRIPLRVEDLIVHDLPGGQASYVVRYTYRLLEG